MLIFALVASLISAFVSAASNRVSDGIVLFNPIPGILFAIVLITLFVRMRVDDTKLWKRVVLVLASAAFYLAAVWSTIFSMDWLDSTCRLVFGSCNQPPWASFFAGGLVGSILLLIVVKGLYRAYTWFWVPILGLFGGLLGTVGAFELGDRGSLGDSLPFIMLYLVWQVGMALGIWYAAGQRDKRENIVIKS